MTEVCIKTFKDPLEAELFKDFLKDQGISAALKKETSKDCGCCSEACVSTELLVDERDKFQSIKILEEAYEE